MRIKLIVTLVLALLFFSACGYKPSSSYAKQEINGTVFVDLEVNIEDPKNSVLIKDALTEQLVYKLGSKLVNNTTVDITSNGVGMAAFASAQNLQNYNQVY